MATRAFTTLKARQTLGGLGFALALAGCGVSAPGLPSAGGLVSFKGSLATPPPPPISAAEVVALVPTLVTLTAASNGPDDNNKALPGDPVNLVLVGSQAQIDSALLEAGWLHPDPVSVGSTIALGWALLRGLPYPTAPVSALYLFGRKQDMAWETNSADVHHRDHCRAWQTTAMSAAGQPVWLMSGTQDIGIEWDARRAEPTHKIGPDVDTERDFIAATVERTQAPADVFHVDGLGNGKPFTGKNGGGDTYHTDGMMTELVF